MFCAVSLGGCGGSSKLASISDTSGGTSQPVSGDTSGGRGDGFDYVDLTFETNIPEKWRIVDTVMELGTGEYFFGEVGVTDFRLTADGNTMSIYSLDGQYYSYLQTAFSDDDDIVRATEIPILVSGKYSATSTNNQYRHYVNYATENYQDYCILEVITILDPISDMIDDFEIID